MKKVMGVLLILCFGLTGCVEPTEEEKVPNCTDTEKLVDNVCVEREVYDTYFLDLNQEIYQSTDNNVTFDDSIDELWKVIGYYDYTQFDYFGELFESFRPVLTEITEEEQSDYYYTKDDIVDVEMFKRRFHFERFAFEEVNQLLEILGDTEVTLNQEVTFRGDYVVSTCCNEERVNYDETITSDFKLLTHAGLDFLYFDLTELKEDGNIDRRVVYMTFDKDSIVSFQVYQLNTYLLENGLYKYEYRVTDYKKGEDSLHYKIAYDRDFYLMFIEPDGSYRSFSHSRHNTTQAIYDVENEIYFWGHNKENHPFNAIEIYEDGLLQLEHRSSSYIDDQNEKQEINNVRYNAKYVEGWEYSFNAYLDETKDSSTSEGPNLYNYQNYYDSYMVYFWEHNIKPFNADTFRIIYEDYTETDYYTYDKITYDELMTKRALYDNIWDDVSYDMITLNIGDDVYSSSNGSTEFIRRMNDQNYNQFLSEFDEEHNTTSMPVEE